MTYIIEDILAPETNLEKAAMGFVGAVMGGCWGLVIAICIDCFMRSMA